MSTAKRGRQALLTLFDRNVGLGVLYRAGKKGKQFVVICAGGHGKMGTKIGDRK